MLFILKKISLVVFCALFSQLCLQAQQCPYSLSRAPGAQEKIVEDWEKHASLVKDLQQCLTNSYAVKFVNLCQKHDFVNDERISQVLAQNLNMKIRALQRLKSYVLGLSLIESSHLFHSAITKLNYAEAATIANLLQEEDEKTREDILFSLKHMAIEEAQAVAKAFAIEAEKLESISDRDDETDHRPKFRFNPRWLGMFRSADKMLPGKR